ncbi:hypothetical protein EVAR_90068_1 [Eumeta japonica]|uniref:Uncharacterized protein n=1 Tax=Eumeta variegata TaxID=151549 RepID=A0A4C2A7Q8_EUMVA|nr:hypothetical protein EVAR_90068_1 [Eumeta japonica]
MSSLLLFGLGSGLSGRRWQLRLPVRILSVQSLRSKRPLSAASDTDGSRDISHSRDLAPRDPAPAPPRPATSSPPLPCASPTIYHT